MIRRTRPILFVLGPAGSGKSTPGRSLAASGFLHFELDPAIDESRTPRAPAALTAGLAVLARTARIGPVLLALESLEGRHASRGTVLTFDCVATLPPRHVAAIERAGIDIVVLDGTGAECLEGYLARKRAAGHVVPQAHWVEHNARSYAQFSLPLHRAHRVTSFESSAFVGAPALVAAVASHLKRRNPQWRALIVPPGADPGAHAGAEHRTRREIEPGNAAMA